MVAGNPLAHLCLDGTARVFLKINIIRQISHRGEAYYFAEDLRLATDYARLARRTSSTENIVAGVLTVWIKTEDLQARSATLEGDDWKKVHKSTIPQESLADML